ncbi:MAG: MotA/TolQ/ExbB proton channel family protein [bacterium]|jgi:biopolymer transport protein TolQ|nr:MotA/TolQ/ExbB proton channel family protein [bacterium]
MIGHLGSLLAVNQIGVAIRSVENSTFLGLSIYIALFLLSIVSWTIIIKKLVDLRAEKRKALEFRRLFNDLEGNIVSLSHEGILPGNSPARLFVSAYEELRLWATLDRDRNRIVAERNVIPALERTLDRSIETEKRRWERGTTMLATITNASPLLGLLGTVWGLFISFQEMSMSSNASLTTVGAGISEALLTTVAGLIVAIPALFAHNAILRAVRNIENDLDGFAMEIINHFDRQVLVIPAAERQPNRVVPRKKASVSS